MALLFMDGFDHVNDDSDIEIGKWNDVDPDVTTSTSVTPHGEGRSVVVANGDYLRTTLPSTATTVIFGLKLRTSALGNGAYFVSLYSSNANPEFRISFNPSGLMRVWRYSTNLGDSSNSITNNTWYHVEVKVVFHNTTGSVVVKVDGSEWINLSNVDTINSSGTIEDFRLENTGSLGTINYCDDLYVMDDAGSSNNDFLGDVRVITLFPDGDSGTPDWTAVGTGTTNADRVDETTHDGDTTYVHSDVVNDVDEYTYDDLPTTPSNIYGVQLTSTAKKIDVGSREIRNFIKHSTSTSNGTTTSLGTTYAHLTDMYETCPSTSSAWTVAQVNAMLAGIEVVS